MDSSAISLIQISAHFHTHHSRDRLQLLSSCYTTYSSSYICPNSPLSSSALELPCPPFSSGHSHSAPTFTFLFCCPDSRSMRYFTSNFVRFVVMSILSFCPNNLCVELITVPNSSLCSTHHCFQLVILCYLSSFATCHCIQLVFVFNLSLCCTSQRIKFVIVFYLLSGGGGVCVKLVILSCSPYNHCVELITVSNSSFYPSCHCVQLVIVLK